MEKTVKHGSWTFLQEKLTAYSRKQFSQRSAILDV